MRIKNNTHLSVENFSISKMVSIYMKQIHFAFLALLLLNSAPQAGFEPSRPRKWQYSEPIPETI
jgi:hypothetical protein